MSIFLQRQEQNPAPTLVRFPYHLNSCHVYGYAVISLSQEISPFQSKYLIILMVSIFFLSPEETRAKPFPQRSTSPGFHCEVNTSLKYSG